MKTYKLILGEITQIIKESYGTCRNKVQVWGQYIGLKASRLCEGIRCDNVLVCVEEFINEAIHEENMNNY